MICDILISSRRLGGTEMENQTEINKRRRRLKPKNIRSPFTTVLDDPEYDLIVEEYNEWLSQGGWKKLKNKKTE